MIHDDIPDVPDFLPDDDERACPDGIHLHCDVPGCPFTFTPDQRADYEQHVRWIHLPTRQLGEDPLPVLTMWLMNGIIRPEEFGELTHAIVQDVLPQPPRVISLTYLFTVIIGLSGVAALFVVYWWGGDANIRGAAVAYAIFALGNLLAFVLNRWDSYRLVTAPPRPPTMQRRVILTPVEFDSDDDTPSGGDA